MKFKVVGVQAAKARRVLISDRLIASAMFKTAVSGPARVGALGLEVDEQADLSFHGGLEKAVYAYPGEHYGYWRGQRQDAGVGGIDDTFLPGALGENLTLQGLLETDVWVGDVLQFANLTLRVTQPREPCFKFNASMGFNQASKRMAQTGYCGFYLAVDQAGTVEAGEQGTLVPGPRRASIPERFNAKLFKHLR
ncbi:MAG: MOSC domain-containing protein [Rhodoferax sp.]